MIFLGICKVILGVLFGGGLVLLLAAYPQSILGVLLIFSGMELSLVIREVTGRTSVFVMLLTAATSLALHSIARGFLIGWGLSLLFLRGILKFEKANGDGKPPH